MLMHRCSWYRCWRIAAGQVMAVGKVVVAAQSGAGGSMASTGGSTASASGSVACAGGSSAVDGSRTGGGASGA
jgi:uncharacterized membrane protein YgcG